MPDFCLPDLGEGLTEAEIVAWRVQVGDEVSIDQIVVEVETAKAAVEVPVPFAGRVAALHAIQGQVVPVGAPLISVATGAAPVGLREPGVATPQAGAAQAAGRSGSVLVGYGTSAGSSRRRRHTRNGHVARVPAASGAAPRSEGRVPVISPLVRKMAHDAGVDLSALAGSGPSGLVLRRDVEQAIARRGPAAQPSRGLVVPVVRDAHQLSARDLSAAIAELTSAARAGTVSPGDLGGGTFTVNNYGVFGVDGSAAIINHPEVAILGLGRIIDPPWVVAGQGVVRKLAELALAFDHRACDGGTAREFLRLVADCIESPASALADL